MHRTTCMRIMWVHACMRTSSTAAHAHGRAQVSRATQMQAPPLGGPLPSAGTHRHRNGGLPLPERAACLRPQSHAKLVSGISAIAARVQADKELTALVRRKFAIKCTTGYSLNALVDFPADQPIEIIKHILIGSEGTFAFTSRATYNTVPEWPHKASAFILFPDVRAAAT